MLQSNYEPQLEPSSKKGNGETEVTTMQRSAGLAAEGATTAKPKRDISIFGVSLNGFSPALQFLFVCALIFCFHVTYGYLQVLI